MLCSFGEELSSCDGQTFTCAKCPDGSGVGGRVYGNSNRFYVAKGSCITMCAPETYGTECVPIVPVQQKPAVVAVASNGSNLTPPVRRIGHSTDVKSPWYMG